MNFAVMRICIVRMLNKNWIHFLIGSDARQVSRHQYFEKHQSVGILKATFKLN